VKDDRQDGQIEEIFRNRLEGLEVSPSARAANSLFRTLTLREFLRFRPLKFNIYYIGILITAVTVSVLVSPGLRKNGSLKKETDTRSFQNINDSLEIGLHKPFIRIEAGDSSAKAHISGFAQPLRNAVSGKKAIAPATSSARARSDTPGAGPGRAGEPLKGKSLFGSGRENMPGLISNTAGSKSLIHFSERTGCVPLAVDFSISTGDVDSCLWNFGNGSFSRQRQTSVTFSVDGTYRIILHVFSGNGSILTDSAEVVVFPKPAARFELSSEKNGLPGTEVHFLNYSSGAVRYLWHFGDGESSELFEPAHRFAKYGNYNITLKAYSQEGCADSAIVSDALKGSGNFIEFPNAFIPNEGGPSGGQYSTKSDESGQVFHPSSSGVLVYHLTIYSKQGIVLFESDDINTGWDGYFRGQISNPGVYIWKVKGNFINGEPYSKVGDVTLLKN
jgi:PKD repeat protein